MFTLNFWKKNLNIFMIFLIFFIFLNEFSNDFLKKYDVEMFFYTWPIKKIKNEKMPNQRHVSEFVELNGEGGILEFFFYEGAN